LSSIGRDLPHDVLVCAESGAIFEKLYGHGILNPDNIEKNFDRLIQKTGNAGGHSNLEACAF
jgi:hypothetical protein